MTAAYTFTYFDCQTCKARIHCDQCEELLTGALLRLEGIQAAQVRMVPKQVTVETNLREDILAERMEDIGLLIE